MKKTVLRAAILIPACILAGYLLLVASYLIPESAIHHTITASYRQLAEEETYEPDSLSGRLLDNFSDSLILLECGYSGDETPFVKAANSPFYSVNWRDPHSSAKAMPEAAASDLTLQNYSRFWHGYQVILRPLLLILNYHQLRILNTVVLFSLLAVILFLMIKKAPACAIPFILSVLLLAPTAIGKNFHFSWAIYIALIAVLLLLKNHQNLRKAGKVELLFLLSGIAVPFLDLITAPTVALTLPLAMLCILEKDREKLLPYLFRCVLFWGLGYALMWAGKWLIAYLQNGPAFIQETINQMKIRADGGSGASLKSRIEPLMLNIHHLANTRLLNLAILAYILYTIFRIIKNKAFDFRSSLKHILPLFLTALIPVLWTLLLSNHSYVHVFFTYRTLVPCVFCALCALNRFGNPPTSASQRSN